VELFNTATENIKGKVEYRHAYIDLSQLEVSLPSNGAGQEVVRTCPAAMGFAFAAGTTDGPGAFDFKQGDDKVAYITFLIKGEKLSNCSWSTLIYIRAIHSGGW